MAARLAYFYDLIMYFVMAAKSQAWHAPPALSDAEFWSRLRCRVEYFYGYGEIPAYVAVQMR